MNLTLVGSEIISCLGYNSGEKCNNMDNSVQGKFTVGCLIWAVNYGKMEVR